MKILIICLFFTVNSLAASKTPTSAFSVVAAKSMKNFKSNAFQWNGYSFDILFPKIGKAIVFENFRHQKMEYFDFNFLSQSVYQFVDQLVQYNPATKSDSDRREMQYQFYGLSQSIKQSDEYLMSVSSDQFKKLHDLLISKSTKLFYLSYSKNKDHDLFWTSYFLSQLKFPIDLTATHLQNIGSSNLTKQQLKRIEIYSAKLAKTSLMFEEHLHRPNTSQLDYLYNKVAESPLAAMDLSLVQKHYLKQLQQIGDSEKVRDFKKQMANQLLMQETKNVFKYPFNIFKYIQFLIGYIFVAWPLEIILIFIALLIFFVQSPRVLTAQEQIESKSLEKIWLMFTKSYLGSNVPFFSKLAASLILFGIGLYFNSARNFVESLMSNI